MKAFLGLLLFLSSTSVSIQASGLIVLHEKDFPPDFRYRIPPSIPRHPLPPQVRSLEVVSHQIKATIDDQIATTTSEQEFHNPNDRVVEGTFLFPVPKGAQLNKFQMLVNGKPVEAELLAADKARGIYENIVRQMKDPGLLEYAGRDLFKVRIFPIEPHRNQKVTVSYTQVLKADAGLLNYQIPLRSDQHSAAAIKNLSVQVDLKTKNPLKSIYSPSHSVEIRRQGDHSARIGFEQASSRPAADFQLFFSHDRQAVEFNLLTYQPGEEEGFFLLLAAPGTDSKTIDVVRKDIVFVVDTSGSMAGKKLEQARKALLFCVENLNDGDRFEVVRFATDIEPLFEKLAEANKENRQKARDFIRELKPTGGTAIDEALRKGLDLARSTEGRPAVVIFLTDGKPTIGNTDENQIVTGALAKAQDRIRVFCFGIGSDVNTHLLDRISEGSRAFSQYVVEEEDLEVKLSSFYSKIKEPVLTDMKIRFPEGVRATRLAPSHLPDLFRGEQLILVGRFKGKGRGNLEVEGRVNDKSRTFSYRTDFSGSSREHDFIPRLWATRRIGYLLDEMRLKGDKSELRDEVTDLAKKYGIVTPYTAYLIVEDESSTRSVRQTGLPRHRFGLEKEQVWKSSVDSFEKRDGAAAIGGSRALSSLKSATVSEQGIALGSEALGLPANEAVPSRRLSTAGGAAGAVTSPEAGRKYERMKDLAARGRYVAGRTFYQNENEWIDSAIPADSKAKRVKVPFASEAYFGLLRKHPEVSPALSLGRKVQILIEGVIYEIVEETADEHR